MTIRRAGWQRIHKASRDSGGRCNLRKEPEWVFFFSHTVLFQKGIWRLKLSEKPRLFWHVAWWMVPEQGNCSVTHWSILIRGKRRRSEEARIDCGILKGISFSCFDFQDSESSNQIKMGVNFIYSLLKMCFTVRELRSPTVWFICFLLPTKRQALFH